MKRSIELGNDRAALQPNLRVPRWGNARSSYSYDLNLLRVSLARIGETLCKTLCLHLFISVNDHRTDMGVLYVNPLMLTFPNTRPQPFVDIQVFTHTERA